MLRAKYRHILRFREIGRVLTKHGLGQLLDYLNSGENSVLRRKNSSRVVISLAERLRTALEELGPTFVKLGQLLSTRPDLLPPDMIMELTNLQDKVSPFPFPVVQSILQDELGANYNDFFVHLDPEPLASASIGQVHRGRLWSGEEVVVKVQRPGVKRMVETDLEILFDSARLFSTRTRWGSFYRVSDMAEEFGNSIREELDYTIEGRNAEKFCELFQGETTTRFPRVFWDYSSPRILTLEYVNCIKISNFAELTKAGYNLSLVARNLANAIFRQIYIHGFFHADPHPGNLGVVPGETIFFMDFGQVGRLNEELKERLVALVLAIVREDVSAIVNILIEMGDAADTVDAAKLKKDIDRVMLKYYALPIQQLKLGDLMKEMLHMAYHYQIRVPSEIVLLAKTLVTLEGVVKQLDPTVSVVDLAEPFGKVLLKEKFAFGRLVKLTGNNLMELGNMAVGLPRRVDNLLYQMERGRLKLQVEHKRLRENVNKLCGALDRLSISVIVAAVILGTCLLSLKSQRTLIWKLPVAEVGLLIGLAMGFWLLVSIIRSARR